MRFYLESVLWEEISLGGIQNKTSVTFTYEAQSQVLLPPLPQKLFLRDPCHDIAATLGSLSEQPFDFTMQYSEHRDSTYVMVNRRKDVARHETSILQS